MPSIRDVCVKEQVMDRGDYIWGIFFSLFFLLATTGIIAVKIDIYLQSILSGFFLATSITSIISFISIYFYQIPAHHFPFDILKSGYYYVGSPLHAIFFIGGVFGVMSTVIDPAERSVHFLISFHACRRPG